MLEPDRHVDHMLDNYDYIHSLRICNTFCFTATMAMQTHWNVMLIASLVQNKG